MNEKELYRKKAQAELDQLKAELDKLKAKADKADADTKLVANKQIKELESKIKEGQTKLNELAETSADAWGSLKGGVDSAMDSLKAGFKDAASKFKE